MPPMVLSNLTAFVAPAAAGAEKVTTSKCRKCGEKGMKNSPSVLSTPKQQH